MTILDTTYSLLSFEVTSIRPHAATKLALTDARMARLRGDLRELTARLQRASAQNRSAA